jgi:micrococcal nuclease
MLKFIRNVLGLGPPESMAFEVRSPLPLTVGSINYEYVTTVTEWKDGDTVVVSINLGFHLALEETVRVYGINCPETRTKSATEKAAGLAAKAFAAELAPVGTTVKLHSFKNRSEEKYGRFLGIITLPDGRDFAQTMIDASHAKSWDGSGQRPLLPHEREAE